jgi:3-deoxy-D-manno-octulosonic-acid transferase
MVYQLYNILLVLAALFLLPYYLLRGIKYGKSRRGVRERLGYYDPQLLSALKEKPVVWIHAVSVGESRAAIPLIKKIHQDYPDHQVLLSNVTETGHAIALENSDIDHCIFFPFDFSWAVKRALSLIQPEAIVIVETEIWPNFTRRAGQLGIPLLLVNGRISDRSYPRYRYVRFLLRPVLETFSAFCMQSQTDSERITTLGALSSRVENTGNMKFDHELKIVTSEEVADNKRRFFLPEDCAILVAGSTHDGEEKILVDAYKNIAKGLGRNLILVLIPRHPERKKDVQSLLKDVDVNCRLRSKLTIDDHLLAPGDVLLVDTLGEVLDLYSVADLVFVGGSFVPIGGHNLLEASLLSKPVLFGPHIHNFKEISKKLVRSGAGVMVSSQSQFESQSLTMLNDPSRCKAMGEAGLTLVAENAGATERTMRHLSKVL